MNAKERKLLAKKQRKFHHTHTDAAGELESIFANAMNRIRSDLVREKIDPASKLGKEVTGIAMYEVDNFVAEILTKFCGSRIVEGDVEHIVSHMKEVAASGQASIYGNLSAVRALLRENGPFVPPELVSAD